MLSLPSLPPATILFPLPPREALFPPLPPREATTRSERLHLREELIRSELHRRQEGLIREEPIHSELHQLQLRHPEEQSPRCLTICPSREGEA